MTNYVVYHCAGMTLYNVPYKPRAGAPEGLLDRVDVVVDRLRQAHHRELVVVLCEVLG